MTDDLRTRIADAIESVRIQRDGDAAFMADAVIRELGLREEFGALDADDSGALYDIRDEIKLCRGETIKRRYITDWEPDC